MHTVVKAFGALVLVLVCAQRAWAVTLATEGTFDEGSQLRVEIGALPGQTVVLLGSATGTSTPATRVCPPQLAPTCLGLADPVLVAWGVADASGSWSSVLTVPRTRDGTMLWLQAAAYGAGGAPTVTPVHTGANPFSTAARRTGKGTLSYRLVGSFQIYANPVASGYARAELRGAGGVMLCRVVADVIATEVVPAAACPSCDHTFDISYTAAEEWSPYGAVGGCSDFFTAPLLELFPPATLGFQVQTYPLPPAYGSYPDVPAYEGGAWVESDFAGLVGYWPQSSCALVGYSYCVFPNQWYKTAVWETAGSPTRRY